jgi:REP element-mobilizing transposase RayT
MFYNPWVAPDISKRNLPHWHQDGAIYFVTFRLADSIPKPKLKEWRERRRLWDEEHGERLRPDEIETRDQLFSKKIDHWLDQGAGECLLRTQASSQIVSGALHFFDGQRYQLIAHVVMPNHVHLLLQPSDDHTLSKILHSIKSYTAHEINKRLNRDGELWQEESYDRIVRSPEELSHFCEYIRRNPEAAKVRLPEGALYLR